MISPIVQISLFAGLVFLVIGSPGAYAITNTMSRGILLSDDGTPTFAGTLVHATVAALLTALYLTTFTMSV